MVGAVPVLARTGLLQEPHWTCAHGAGWALDSVDVAAPCVLPTSAGPATCSVSEGIPLVPGQRLYLAVAAPGWLLVHRGFLKVPAIRFKGLCWVFWWFWFDAGFCTSLIGRNLK